MNICFSGKMMVEGKFMPRAKVKALVETAGHQFHDKMNFDTDLLVVGKQKKHTAVTDKMLKAHKWGRMVINCDDAVILLSCGGAITSSLDGTYEEEL